MCFQELESVPVIHLLSRETVHPPTQCVCLVVLTAVLAVTLVGDMTTNRFSSPALRPTFNFDSDSQAGEREIESPITDRVENKFPTETDFKISQPSGYCDLARGERLFNLSLLGWGFLLLFLPERGQDWYPSWAESRVR